jgi:hypothetical protein
MTLKRKTQGSYAGARDKFACQSTGACRDGQSPEVAGRVSDRWSLISGVSTAETASGLTAAEMPQDIIGKVSFEG